MFDASPTRNPLATLQVEEERLRRQQVESRCDLMAAEHDLRTELPRIISKGALGALIYFAVIVFGHVEQVVYIFLAGSPQAADIVRGVCVLCGIASSSWLLNRSMAKYVHLSGKVAYARGGLDYIEKCLMNEIARKSE